MKGKKLFIVGLSLLFGLMIYGLNYSFSRFSFAGIDFFDVKHERAEEKVDDNLAAAFSISIPNNVLLEDDFEGTTSNWTFTTSSTSNKWHIGTAVSKSGSKSMYITDDNGVSNSYSDDSAVVHAISSSFTLDNINTDYLFSFDWRAKAESSWDYLSLWLVLDTYNPVGDYSISASSSGGIEIAKISGQENFVNVNLIKDLSAYKGKKIKLVFQWLNDSSVFHNPAGAIDNFEFAKVTCKAPEFTDLKVSNIGLNTAKVDWKVIDPSIVNYDLYVGTSNILPKTLSNIINTTNVTSHNLTNLQPSTYYYIWYRSACSVGDESFWVGPLKFMTLCTPFNLPFNESFDEVSTTLGCWGSIDSNNDSTSSNDNNWKVTKSVDTTNLDAMQFKGENKQHDDYLLSPEFVFTGGMYQIEFDYKTGTKLENVDLLLSLNGRTATNYSTVIQTNVIKTNSVYTKKTVVINGYTGTGSFALHVKTNGESNIFIDNFSIVPLACSVPTDISFTSITHNSVSADWNDALSSNWEYYVHELGYGLPAGLGAFVNSSDASFSTQSDGTPLDANTDYEIYVRAKCDDNTYGNWIGPIGFKTLCNPIASLPFIENFNKSSTSLSCWSISDKFNDKSADGLNRTWRSIETGTYEGDGAMHFTGSAYPHNDWLITPTFTLAATKMYELSFYYKTASAGVNLTILKSKGNVFTESFTVLNATEKYVSSNYIKKTIYIENESGATNFAFLIESSGSASIHIDEFTFKEASCKIPDPNVIVNSLTINSATLSWNDDSSNTSWEVYVQALNNGALPVGSGASVATKTATVNRVHTAGGGNLQPNTEYEFFVRGTCGLGLRSSWVGPIKFRTPCDTLPLPFFEGFNSNSPTLSCWTIGNTVDSSFNYASYNYDSFEGDRHMRLVDYNGSQMNHFLISPSFKVEKTKIYKISFQYKAYGSYHNEFEVSLSTAGPIFSEFKTVVSAMKVYKADNWKKKVVYFSGIDANINIGIRSLNGEDYSENNIDAFEIEEVSCVEPIDLDITNVKDKEVTLKWEDKFNKSWEYALLPSPSTTPKAPKVNGTTTTSVSTVVTKDFNGNDLIPNTRYVYYVRAKCSSSEFSEWIGPFEFYTACGTLQYPYWEGFNTTSKSIRCWTILDLTNDGDSYSGKWNAYNYSMYEGDRGMYFNSYSFYNQTHDDWLISPDFVAIPTKYYRLKYHYRAPSYSTNKFEVKLSTSGTNPASFTQTLIPLTTYSNNNYVQEVKFLTGVSGTFNIGFHVVGSGESTIYLDNVFIEEVQGCPEPMNLEISNVTKNSASIKWTDDFNATKWEYFVQEAGLPVPTNAGTVTTTKQNVLTKDNKGNNLLPGTYYEVYVRTVCGNGENSIWQGPVKFMTICDVFNLPLIETFESNSDTERCWTSLDAINNSTSWTLSQSYPYEGKVGARISKSKTDDWLISPTVRMTTANYILKFRYQTGPSASSVNMEVLLSNNGTQITDFNRSLISKKIYKNSKYVEEVLFFTGTAGDVNIAWHVLNDTSITMNIDNISLKEITSCPEPYDVEWTNATATTLQVGWKQTGGITNWELLVLPSGSIIPTNPTGLINVSGTPSTVLTVGANAVYDIYVRAKCSGNSGTSDWSTKLIAGPSKTNDDCLGALPVSINQGLVCDLKTFGSTMGATKSAAKVPNCQSTTAEDVWFEFTADAEFLSFSFLDLVVGSGLIKPDISLAFYTGTCTTINTPTSVPVKCENIYGGNDKYEIVVSNFIPGTKYYLRVGFPTGEYYFNLCISNNKGGKLIIEPSGTPNYSIDELVKNVLIKSNCDLVDSIRYQAGNNSTINTLGYFNKGTSNFPFEEGIVLTTQAIDKTVGPYDPNVMKQKVPGWVGDPDLNDVINSIGGAGFGNTKYVSVLEFNFTPVKDSIKFEYIFASESYVDWCAYVCDAGGALFAAWLTEIETGEGQNLALVPGTEDPIALSTIRDSSKSGAGCGSVNPEFYGQHYYDGPNNPLEAPINYAGVTVPMSSETVYVKPGKKYRIKLAIADFCGNSDHTSAVFFNAGSFDLGNLDLGADLLVDTGNALCSGEPKVIKSGLSSDPDLVEIKWFKDDVLIPEANTPEYTVEETGTYKVVGTYKNINCDVVGEIRAEIFPPIHTVVEKYQDIEICRYTRDGATIDLISQEKELFIKSNQSDYKLTYYRDQELTDLIEDPANYPIGKENTSQTIYLLIEDIRTGCKEEFSFKLVSTTGVVPATPSNVLVCDRYELPSLAADQYYFDEPGGKGKEYKAGDVLLSGKYTMYVLQANGPDCFEETSFEIEVTEKKIARVFEDQILACDLYVLKELDEFSKYYVEVAGQRIEVASGTPITQTNTRIYVVAKSIDGVCEDESSFMIRYEECPIPKGVSPNGDGINDVFDLSKHGVTSIKIFNRNGSEVYSFEGLYAKEWFGQGKGNKPLPSGTYFYVIQSFDKTRTGWVELNY